MLRNGRFTDLYSRGVESFYDSDGTDENEDIILGK